MYPSDSRYTVHHLSLTSPYRGYNIGTRLIEDFLARSSLGRCSDFKEVGEVVAKVRCNDLDSHSNQYLIPYSTHRLASNLSSTSHPQYPIFLHHRQVQVPHRRLKDPLIPLHHPLGLGLLSCSHSKKIHLQSSLNCRKRRSRVGSGIAMYCVVSLKVLLRW